MEYDIVKAEHPISWFNVAIEKDVIATPRLISEGTRGPVEAYRESEYRGKGVWRMRDDSYDPEGIAYQRVMVLPRRTPTF